MNTQYPSHVLPLIFIFASGILPMLHAPLWLSVGCVFVGAGLAMYEYSQSIPK